MARVLVGGGRAVIHASPLTSLEIMCGPFTPYVSLVGKLSSACIINNHVRNVNLISSNQMKYHSK